MKSNLINQDRETQLRAEEILVLRMLHLGLSTEAIAESTNYSVDQVNKMLSLSDEQRSILLKIDVPNRVAAAIYYEREYCAPSGVEISVRNFSSKSIDEQLVKILSEVKHCSQGEYYACMLDHLCPLFEKLIETDRTQVFADRQRIQLAIELWSRFGDAARTLGQIEDANRLYDSALAAVAQCRNEFGRGEELLIREVHLKLMKSSVFYMEIPKRARGNRSKAISETNKFLEEMQKWATHLPAEYRNDAENQNLWLSLRKNALEPESLKHTRELIEQFEAEADSAPNNSVRVSELNGVIRCSTGMESVLMGLSNARQKRNPSSEFYSLARKAFDELENLASLEEISELERIRAYKAMAIFIFLERDTDQVQALLAKAQQLAGDHLLKHQQDEISWLVKCLLGRKRIS